MQTLIYVDCLERATFFKRFALAMDGGVVFVTNRLSVCWVLREFNVKLFRNIDTDIQVDDQVLQRTLSVAGKYHSLAQAKKISQSVMAYLESLHQRYMFDRCILWNGATTIATTISLFAKDNSIRTTFLELANLPNKLFYDTQGVNAASQLFLYPEIVDGYTVSDERWVEWKEEYFTKKSAPKQASNKHTVRYLQILDYIGFVFGCIKEDYRNPLKIIMRKFQNKKQSVYPSLSLSQEYIFFPLQVSNDTQIILNSDIDNIGVLKLLRAQYPNTTLFAKIHPAEEDRDFIDAVKRLAHELGIVLVGNDTKELIQNAKKIAVINSTVGLEALIYGKEIEVFGRAIYTHFHHARLKNYICGYLANIEYFSNDTIDPSEVQRILA